LREKSRRSDNEFAAMSTPSDGFPCDVGRLRVATVPALAIHVSADSAVWMEAIEGICPLSSGHCSGTACAADAAEKNEPVGDMTRVFEGTCGNRAALSTSRDRIVARAGDSSYRMDNPNRTLCLSPASAPSIPELNARARAGGDK
jgi:hypothetical protein